MNQPREVHLDILSETKEGGGGSTDTRHGVDEVGARQLVQLKLGMVHDGESDEPEPAHLGQQRRRERPAERVGTVVHEEEEESQYTPSRRVRHVPAKI
jgi:hypothetical protein